MLLPSASLSPSQADATFVLGQHNSLAPRQIDEAELRSLHGRPVSFGDVYLQHCMRPRRKSVGASFGHLPSEVAILDVLNHLVECGYGAGTQTLNHDFACCVLIHGQVVLGTQQILDLLVVYFQVAQLDRTVGLAHQPLEAVKDDAVLVVGTGPCVAVPQVAEDRVGLSAARDPVQHDRGVEALQCSFYLLLDASPVDVFVALFGGKHPVERVGRLAAGVNQGVL